MRRHSIWAKPSRAWLIQSIAAWSASRQRSSGPSAVSRRRSLALWREREMLWEESRAAACCGAGCAATACCAGCTACCAARRLLRLERTVTERLRSCETSQSVGELSVSGATLTRKFWPWWFLLTSSIRRRTSATPASIATSPCDEPEPEPCCSPPPPNTLRMSWFVTGICESAYRSVTRSGTRRSVTSRFSKSTSFTESSMHFSRPPSSLYHVSSHGRPSSITSR
mmetsp:Transcript_7865/g.24115  ORF Transcript_7865/g.24115 Transcript_7865/m.24115 type:complete len:226 (+) Transcript_7865:1954-2631(+)